MTEPAATLREELLTVKEYAFLKRVHPETVKRWIKAGVVKAVRNGTRGHWRIPQAVAICSDS